MLLHHPRTGSTQRGGDRISRASGIAAPFADDSVAGLAWPLVHVFRVN